MALWGYVYQTLHPARYQVREGVRGYWFVLDTNGRNDGSVIGDVIYKNSKMDYWRTHTGALNAAKRLNAQG